jgi:hypothetical protein
MRPGTADQGAASIDVAPMLDWKAGEGQVAAANQSSPSLLLRLPDVTARKIVELAIVIEAEQDDRIHIEKINGPMQLRATPAEYKASLDHAIANGWLVLHESSTIARFTQTGADLFA